MFPKLFRGVGEGSKHRINYAATEADKTKLHKWFREKFTEYVAVRNILIMDVADTTGLRLGSINSLRCSQFDDATISQMGRSLPVTPDNQKFGYENVFDFPPDLVDRIRSFICGERAALLWEMGWSDRRTDDRLFISARDGTGLQDQTLSAIFGDAFQAIGAPKGAGLHSLRRKYAEDEIFEETMSRAKLGLDTSVTTISAAVSLKLGQSNPESLSPYVNRRQSRIAATNIEKRSQSKASKP